MRLVCRGCDGVVDASGPDAAGLCDCGEPYAVRGVGAGVEAALGTLVPAEDRVSMDAGGTPTRALPRIAEAVDVDGLVAKDEGANPTGSVWDRAAEATVTAARAAGHDRVALAAAGDAGVAVAAHAARAGLDAGVYLPSRARFDAKAAVNVHGGDMTVVRGRLADARDATADDDGRAAGPFASPWHHAALAAIGRELADRVAPNHVVAPVADGSLVLGLDDGLPDGVALHAVQPAGCAPVVDAVRAAGDATDAAPEAVRAEDPDTVVGELEDPAPPGGAAAARAVVDRGGAARAVEDDEALDAGIVAARRDGWHPSLAGAVALAGCDALAERFGAGDTVAVVGTGVGRFETDALRSRLMARGE